MTKEEILKETLGGCTLAASKTKEGFKTSSGKLFKEFPSEITIMGRTFTLESVDKVGPSWVNAEYA